MDKPHYQKKEQIMCVIEGGMTIALVPHIYRQELYVGKWSYDSIFKDPKLGSYDEWNVSPVNFFMPDIKKYPNFMEVEREFINLSTGDCAFIPAFYHYHM